MKKIVIFILIALIVILIYIVGKDNKIYYLALGDDITLRRDNENIFTDNITNLLIEKGIYKKTIKDFANLNYRTTDLLNDIINNKKLRINSEELTIKNAIIKAEFITISIGMNDFINYIGDYKIIDDNIINLKEDMNNLLKEIRSICKEPIVLIGIYNPKIDDNNLDRTLQELNNLYNILADEYNIYYLNIYDEVNKLQEPNTIYLNAASYEMISSK